MKKHTVLHRWKELNLFLLIAKCGEKIKGGVAPRHDKAAEIRLKQASWNKQVASLRHPVNKYPGNKQPETAWNSLKQPETAWNKQPETSSLKQPSK